MEMSSLRKILIILFISVISIITYGKEKIKIGYFENKPHIYFEAGKTKGVLVEYWGEIIAPKMDVEIEWIGPIPMTRLFYMLNIGEINCIALLSKNDEREISYDYPENYFRNVTGGIAVLKSSKLKEVKNYEELENMRITFFKEGYIPKEMKNKKIKWDFLPSVNWKIQGIHKLIYGRTDAVYDPDYTTLIYVKKNNKEINIIKLPNSDSQNYSVFSKVDNKKFLKKYNSVIKDNNLIYEKMLIDFLILEGYNKIKEDDFNENKK
jgi:hypothetical protein